MVNRLEKPLVSVIIPAYNCADWIRGAVDSALRQEVSLEILVINDCSKDHLDQVMDEYKENPKVRYIHNQVNLGAAGTRNRGIKLAEGEYVAFLDADDLWRKEKLKKQLQIMQETGCVLCATGRELMTPEGRLTGRVFTIKKQVHYRDLLKGNCIACSSVILKTEVARQFPMHHDKDSHEDYIMWLEILEKYREACAVNEPLLIYRLSNTGKSGSKWQSAAMTFRVYRYMGFGWGKSLLYFGSYVLHGIWKYFIKR